MGCRSWVVKVVIDVVSVVALGLNGLWVVGLILG